MWQKCEFEASLCVSNSVFALLPFACGCPVWLIPTKCSRETHLQMLSNTFFLSHHRARILLEWWSPPPVGHLDLYPSCHVKFVLESMWTWQSHAVTLAPWWLLDRRCSQMKSRCLHCEQSALLSLVFEWKWKLKIQLYIFFFPLDAAWPGQSISCYQCNSQD